MFCLAPHHKIIILI